MKYKKKLHQGVKDITIRIKNDIGQFTKGFENDVLGDFDLQPKVLAFKVSFDTGTLNTDECIEKSTSIRREPREIFGFKLSWLPKWTYTKHTTTSYSVNTKSLIKSVTAQMKSGLDEQIKDLQVQLQSVVQQFKKDITLLCSTIKHSSEQAISRNNDTAEKQSQRKELYNQQLKQLDVISDYALELVDGLNEIRG